MVAPPLPLAPLLPPCENAVCPPAASAMAATEINRVCLIVPLLGIGMAVPATLPQRDQVGSVPPIFQIVPLCDVP